MVCISTFLFDGCLSGLAMLKRSVSKTMSFSSEVGDRTWGGGYNIGCYARSNDSW